MTCRVAPLLVLALALPVHAEELWTTLSSGAKQKTVQIPSVAPLADKAGPAVLVIFTETELPAHMLPPGHPPLPGMGDGPPMPFPFGEEGPHEVQGQGAGFLVSPTGFALTNHHVVENARRIQVAVGSSHELINATVVGSDEKTDIALIKLDGGRSDWPVLPLGDSDAMKVGDFVVAIGSPFGLEQSVSLGILSARGRRDIAPSGRAGLYDFLQTDASINPGNSGGPLLNLAGEVVGINSAVNAAGSGIGFAIPINMAKRVATVLRDKGRFERSWIGVAIQKVAPDVAKGMGLDRARGALVRSVVDDGPGASAGLEPGDIITRFDGRPIEDANDLPLIAGDAGVGKIVEMEVLRDKKKRTMKITLGAHPDNAAKEAAARPTPAAPDKKDGALGLTVVSLDEDARARLGVKPDVQGARVSKVRPGSPAANAGLVADDVVLKVDGAPVTGSKDFAAAVKAAATGDVLRLSVRRGGSTIFVALVKP
jgi:serine protease Do